LPISVKHLFVAVVVLVTLLPYTLVAELLSIPFISVAPKASLLLQVMSIGFLVFCYVKTTARSLKLFWQYLVFAVLGVLVSRFLPGDDGALAQQLSRDFATLFVFFFVLLAIETNPHLSDLPHKNYITGSVPAIFFTVICFCYFVLLPAEFSEQVYQTGKPTLLFAMLICTLILVRLIICLLQCRDRFWHFVFGFISVATAAKFATLAIEFYQGSGTGVEPQDYWITLVSMMPYGFLTLAAFASLNMAKQPTPIEKPNDPECYIMVLMLVLTSIHLYGHEQEVFYAIESSLQSAVVTLWLIMGVATLLSLSYRRKKLLDRLDARIIDRTAKFEALSADKKHLSHSLINSEDKAIVSVSNNAILTTATDGKILSANPAAVQMFQCLEQEMVDSSVSKLFSEKDEMNLFFDFQSNVYSLQRKEKGISIECLSLRSDGTEFPAQAELQWAERADNPLIVLTFINLTARKLAEKQTLELKDKFIANISHEFRTPLTIINGILDRYLTKTSNEDEIQDLSTAKRNGLRLVRMVEQLLELSRLSDNPTLVLSHFKLDTLMSMPVDSFSRLSAHHQLTFSSDIPPDLWIECDAQGFEKIIFNLISNAVKYTPAGGDIKVIAYTEQDTVILDVIDSGIGITKDSQNKIFERFQRADDVLNQNTFGVGIGLSLVNELVRTHGWRISLVSEHGVGSKFSVSIPLAAPQAQEAQLPEGLSEHEVSSILVEQRSVTSTQSTHSQQVVLVIEDNLDMQSHIKQVIEQQHHCILAGNGELGVELAKEYVPDLIVSDLMLPGIDGFEVLRQVKKHEVTAHIPVILLTARSDLDSRLEGLNLNADEYLSKPFNQAELLTRIQNLIDNRKQLQSSFMKKHEDKAKVERKIDSQEKVAKLTGDDTEVESLDEKFLAKLEALVADCYTDAELDIYQMAEKLAMSERQLQRKIKVLLGTNPNNFIREFRLKKAKEMLKSGTQIGIVAFDVGFSSQTYFGRCFKEAFGCTPKQYQTKCKDGEEE
jgi:PAS domain S-box-containing protein